MIGIRNIGKLEVPRNPRIADVFYRRGLIETWGRGITLIIDGYKAAGLPEPTFEVAEPFVNLIIRFKAPLSNSGGLSGGLSGANGTLNGMLNGTLKLSGAPNPRLLAQFV